MKDLIRHTRYVCRARFRSQGRWALLVGALSVTTLWLPTAAIEAQSPGWFVNVANHSDFAYKTNNDYTGRKYFPQPMAGGVALLDFNHDGLLDIFLSNGAKLPELKKTGSAYDNALLQNMGNGVFKDVTAQAGLAGKQTGYSFGVAAGDYDNDGNEDLFVASAGRNTLYHNNGDGTFSDSTQGSGLESKPANVLTVGAAWFDFDNDGLLDLVITNYTVWDPRTDSPCYAGAADPNAKGPRMEIYCSPRDVVSTSPRLYRNVGHGKFKDVTEESGIGAARGKGMGVSVADFNGDGRMDIFVANDTMPNLLFLNQGNGVFKEEADAYGVAYNEQGALVSGMGSDARDFDNDGYVDLITNDLASQLFNLYKNVGGRSFDDVSSSTNFAKLSHAFSGWSLGFIDFDNDGWLDIYSANGDVDDLKSNSKQHDTMFRNLDGAHLADVSEQMGPDFLPVGYQRGAAFGDLNNDGFEDIVVTSLGQKPRILINQRLNHNHWLLFDLRGHRSNRDGIGANLKLTTSSGRVLYNQATTSVGLMSSGDRRVHFGMGADAVAASVEIHWPSGIVQRLSHVVADQIVKVEEPEK